MPAERDGPRIRAALCLNWDQVTDEPRQLRFARRLCDALPVTNETVDVPEVRQLEDASREDFLQNFVVVATHHKTGSVWMRTVFRAIGLALGVPFINPSKKALLHPASLPGAAILFSDHSDFSNCPWILDHPQSRILHVIRDPRDVIISAMHYHRHAKEAWLHTSRKGFGGLTYQQKLNRLQDDHSRYIFEMERTAKRVIRDMQNWNYSRPNSFECKYEAMVADDRMELITKILVHLGFEDHQLEASRRIFWENSLFGNLKGSQSAHIRSGALRQWQVVFDEALAAVFVEKFPDALIRLGYESDNSWIDSIVRRCPPEQVDVNHRGNGSAESAPSMPPISGSNSAV